MKKSVLSISVTLLLMGVLIYHLDFSGAGTVAASFSMDMAGQALGLYLAYLSFISWRFYLLLHSRNIKLSHLGAIVSAHNMYNRLLPFRSGEITYIYFLKKLKGVPAAEALGSLLVARILDYLTISLFFLVGVAATYGQQSLLLKKISLVMSVFLALAVLLLVFIGFLGEKGLLVLQKILQALRLEEKPFSLKILGKLEELTGSLKIISNRKTYALGLLSSIGVWGCMFYLCYLLILEFGIGLAFFPVVIASTFSILANVLPVNGVAGFGTMEASWTAGYMLVGVSKQAAIGSAFYVHMTVLAGAVIYGVAGLLYMRIIPEKGA